MRVTTAPHIALILSVVLHVWGAPLCPGAGMDAGQDPVQDRFEQANRLYAEGKYTEAIRLYEELLLAGTNTTGVLYNLANAYQNAGRTGRAILLYRRVLLVEPRAADARWNLHVAQASVKDPVWRPGKLARWLETITVDEWAYGLAGCVWIVLFLIGLDLVMQRPLAWLRSAIYAIAGAGVILLACLILAVRQYRQLEHLAVVTAGPVSARQGPFERAEPAFDLADGAEVLIEQRRPGWVLVRVDKTRAGWVQETAIEPVLPHR